MPTVSVIIPTYNRASMLKEAIQSVLDQTYSDFEIIVVDDGSTDNTEEVVKSFADNRVRYVRHGRNRGAGAARNTGIRAASAEYIAFQDSDDKWLPQKLDKQISILEAAHPKVGIVYTGFWRIKDHMKIYIPSPNIMPKEGNVHNILLRYNFIGIPVTLIKRECFEKAGMFDEAIPLWEDWELWIRISKYYEFRYIDEPLVITYHTPGGVNEQSRLIQIKSLKLIVQKHFEDFKMSRRLLAGHYSDIGVLLCSNGELTEGRNYLMKAIVLYPLNVKVFSLTLITLLGQHACNIALNNYNRIRQWLSKK